MAAKPIFTSTINFLPQVSDIISIKPIIPVILVNMANHATLLKHILLSPGCQSTGGKSGQFKHTALLIMLLTVSNLIVRSRICFNCYRSYLFVHKLNDGNLFEEIIRNYELNYTEYHFRYGMRKY